LALFSQNQCWQFYSLQCFNGIDSYRHSPSSAFGGRSPTRNILKIGRFQLCLGQADQSCFWLLPKGSDVDGRDLCALPDILKAGIAQRVGDVHVGD
jgi:hypothetical protein